MLFTTLFTIRYIIFAGRVGIIAVLEFIPTFGAERTGAAGNKTIVVMSWSTSTSDIKFHVLTGSKTWISK